MARYIRVDRIENNSLNIMGNKFINIMVYVPDARLIYVYVVRKN